MASFIEEHQLSDCFLPLGLIFPFPCHHENLGVGRLVQWSRVFSCAGIQGEEAVQMLNTALKRHQVCPELKIFLHVADCSVADSPQSKRSLSVFNRVQDLYLKKIDISSSA